MSVIWTEKDNHKLTDKKNPRQLAVKRVKLTAAKENRWLRKVDG